MKRGESSGGKQPKKVAKAAAQAPSASEPQEPASSSSGRRAMDKASVSKMLGFLKYHARSGNKNEEAVALAKYHSAGEDKSGFLEKFEANKGSLKWIYDLEKTTTETENTTVAQKEIHKMNLHLTYVMWLSVCHWHTLGGHVPTIYCMPLKD